MNEEIEIESDRKLRNRKRIKSKRTFTDEIMESKEKNVLNIRKETKKTKKHGNIETRKYRNKD
jgi:hypothetical protein